MFCIVIPAGRHSYGKVLMNLMQTRKDDELEKEFLHSVVNNINMFWDATQACASNCLSELQTTIVDNCDEHLCPDALRALPQGAKGAGIIKKLYATLLKNSKEKQHPAAVLVVQTWCCPGVRLLLMPRNCLFPDGAKRKASLPWRDSMRDSIRARMRMYRFWNALLPAGDLATQVLS